MRLLIKCLACVSRGGGVGVGVGCVGVGVIGGGGWWWWCWVPSLSVFSGHFLHKTKAAL